MRISAHWVNLLSSIVSQKVVSNVRRITWNSPRSHIAQKVDNESFVTRNWVKKVTQIQRSRCVVVGQQVRKNTPKKQQDRTWTTPWKKRMFIWKYTNLVSLLHSAALQDCFAILTGSPSLEVNQLFFGCHHQKVRDWEDVWRTFLMWKTSMSRRNCSNSPSRQPKYVPAAQSFYGTRHQAECSCTMSTAQQIWDDLSTESTIKKPTEEQAPTQ